MEAKLMIKNVKNTFKNIPEVDGSVKIGAFKGFTRSMGASLILSNEQKRDIFSTHTFVMERVQKISKMLFDMYHESDNKYWLIPYLFMVAQNPTDISSILFKTKKSPINTKIASKIVDKYTKQPFHYKLKNKDEKYFIKEIEKLDHIIKNNPPLINKGDLFGLGDDMVNSAFVDQIISLAVSHLNSHFALKGEWEQEFKEWKSKKKKLHNGFVKQHKDLFEKLNRLIEEDMGMDLLYEGKTKSGNKSVNKTTKQMNKVKKTKEMYELIINHFDGNKKLILNEQRSVHQLEKDNNKNECFTTFMFKIDSYYEFEVPFRRKPTWTLPDPYQHPKFMFFNKWCTQPNGYKNFKIIDNGKKAFCSADFRLLDHKTHEQKWETLTAVIEQRFFRYILKSKPAGYSIFADSYFHPTKKTTEYNFSMHDRAISADLNVRDIMLFQGISIVFDRKKLSKTKDPLKQKCKLKISYSVPKYKQVTTKDTIMDGVPYRMISVDLAMRNNILGHFEVADVVGHKLTEIKNFNRHINPKGSHQGYSSRKMQIDLKNNYHKAKQGKSSKKIYEHVTNQKDNIVKKSARIIISEALKNNADCICLENLSNFSPNCKFDKRKNKLIARHGLRSLITTVKSIAQRYGIKVILIAPYGTSKKCSLCGEYGTRYSKYKGEEKESICGRIFVCSNPQCSYHKRIDADLNATRNIMKLGIELNMMEYKDKKKNDIHNVSCENPTKIKHSILDWPLESIGTLP